MRKLREGVAARIDASVSFPLFVFEKDDYSMFVVETPDKVLDHMEPIDIENGEYLCWDANGGAVRISISGQRVTGICYGSPCLSVFAKFKTSLICRDCS
jgi:hypothetical protein